MSDNEVNGNIVIKPEFYKTDYSDAIVSDDIKPHLETIYKRWDDLGFTEENRGWRTGWFYWKF